ncbi:unnamed protein product [Bursaphelenchus xylophilus]|uniref:(pine wood nematode) hypothetical protein n=1 Tax=Bursaphelenchus xylophilus TaxID=6326 RepID=A0A1I7S6S6_BURXY|nr:unnamed protein product [Bursaphelenchus xylophilus]CAG9079829.1 unnamed protein product [Bursaphelenchus xylophilus]
MLALIVWLSAVALRPAYGFSPSSACVHNATYMPSSVYPCPANETCIEVNFTNFTEYMEEYHDQNEPLYFASYHSKYDNNTGRFTRGPFCKEGERRAVLPFRWMTSHRIYGSQNPELFLHLMNDQVEIVTMEDAPLANVSNDLKYSIASLLSPQLADTQVKSAFVFQKYLFLNATTAIDTTKLSSTSNLKKGINDQATHETNNTGLIGLAEIPSERVNSTTLQQIREHCFNPNEYCATDISNGELYVHNRPIAYKFKDVLVETYWFQRHCEVLPMFRIRHRKMPGNKVFDFPEVQGFITHNDSLDWGGRRMDRRSIMPIIRGNEPIFEFISKHTTMAPPSASTAPPPSAAPILGGNVLIEAASSVIHSANGSSVAKYLRVLIPFW